MKISALGKLLSMLFISALIFTACESTTDTDDPVDTRKPEPPTNLMATSVSDSEILLNWTPSVSESDSLFEAYTLYVSSQGGGPLSPVELHPGDRPYTIDGLDEGVIYTFELEAKFTNAEVSETRATVQWSPASRFNQDYVSQPIEVYEYTSDFGSGLDLFYYENESTMGPRVLTVGDKADWNLGIDTRDGEILVMPASEISYATSEPDPTDETEINNMFYVADALNAVLDSAALNTFGDYSPTQTFDLNADYIDPDHGVVLLVRSRASSDDEWSYSKVLIKRAPNGGWLQGTGDNEYLEMVISFQRTPGVPYAKFSKAGGAE